MNVTNAMKTPLTKRLLKLELAAGLTETAADRRDHELGQILLQKMLAERAREGLPPPKVSQEFLSSLTLKDIMYRLHIKGGCPLVRRK